MTYAEKIRLYEKKDHLIKRTKMTDEQKAEVIDFFNKHREQENNISDKEWNKPETLIYERFKQIIDAFNNRNTKSNANRISNKIGIEGIEEGKDYIDLGEYNDALLGTFHAYIPLSWLGSKTLASSKVPPQYGNKTSATWCIGWSSNTFYWKDYFFKNLDDFLILCGEDIPTKKVCFEIRKNYKLDSFKGLKFRSKQDLATKGQISNNREVTVWNYIDAEEYIHAFLWEVFKTDSKANNLTVTVALLNELLNKAKTLSDKRRDELLQEATKPVTIMKSEYTAKLISYRNNKDAEGNSNYNRYLRVGIQTLRFFDRFADILRKYDMSIAFNFIDPLKHSDDRYSPVKSLIEWYEENKNKTLAFNYYYNDIDVPYSKSSIHYIPVFLNPKNALATAGFDKEFQLFYERNNIVYTKSLSKLVSMTQRLIKDATNCYGYRTFMLFRDIQKADTNISPYAYDSVDVIADFNEYDILTINDYLAFFGEFLLKYEYMCIALKLFQENRKIPALFSFLRHLDTDPEKMLNENITLIAKLLNVEPTLEAINEISEKLQPASPSVGYNYIDVSFDINESSISNKDILSAIDLFLGKFLPISEIEELPKV